MSVPSDPFAISDRLSVLIAKDGTTWTMPLAPTNEYLYPTERDDLRRSFRFTGERDEQGRKVYREKRPKRFP